MSDVAQKETHAIAEVFQALFSSESRGLRIVCFSEREKNFCDTFADVVQNVFARLCKVKSLTTMRRVAVSAALVENTNV